MADRVSTIRFKAEGTQEVASKVQELNRAILRQQRELARAVQVAASSGNADAIKNAQTQAKALTNLHAMRAKEISDLEAKEAINAKARSVAVINEQVARAEKQAKLDQRAAERKEKLATRVTWQQYQTEQAALKNREKATDRAVTLHARERESLVRNLQAVDAARERSTRRGGGGRQDMAGALSGFGGKMVLGQAAGGALGDAVNDPAMGQAAGGAISAFMFGGPAIGAAVVGMEAIGAAFRINRERAIAAQQATAQYVATLSQLQSTWSGLATGSIESTPFGNAMVKQVEAAREVTAKANQDAVVSRQQGWRWGLRDIELRGANQRAELGQEQEAIAKRYRDAEYPKQLEYQQRILEANKGVYAVTAMRPGLLKEERTLTAKIAADDEKRLAGQQLRRDQAWAGYRQAMELFEKENSRTDLRAKSEEEIAARQAELGRLQDRANEAAEAYNRLNGVDAQETAAARAEQANEVAAQQVRYQEALRDQTNQTAASQVAAESRGYRQTVALQEESFRVQLDNARQNGQAMVALVEQQQANLRTVRQREARESLENGMAAWSPRMAQRAFGRRMDDARAMGATPDEMAAMQKEELTGQYRRQTEEARLQIAVKRRQMTMKEADIARAMLADPMARAAGPEGDAVRKAIAENAEAQDALRWRPRNPGQFSTQYQGGLVDTTVLDQTPRRDALTTAREQLQIQKLMADTLVRISQRGSLN